VRIASAPWVSLLERMLQGVPALPGARCRNRPHLFDGHDGPNGERTRQAIELCARCPALAACEEWAAGQRCLVGVVAGQLHEHFADSARSKA
jgi:WhiB family redox-sensing transcriptional regulator